MTKKELKWALDVVSKIAEGKREEMPNANAQELIRAALNDLGNFVSDKESDDE